MIRRRQHRVLAIGLSFFGLISVSLAPSDPPGTDPTWAALPDDLRDRIHRTAIELPPFPEDPSTLRDVRNWPRSRTFDGERYELMLTEWDHDAGLLVKSPEEIRKGRAFQAQYMRQAPDGKRVSRGPFYVWGIEGGVVEQAYLTARSTDLRTYDPAGRVMQHTYSRPAQKSWFSCGNSRSEWAEEWFDSSGSLLGVRVDGAYYWAGVRRTDEEFQRLRRDWGPWKAWRDSVREARARAGGPSSSPAPSPPPEMTSPRGVSP